MRYNIRGNKIDVTEAIISARGKDQKVEVTIWSGKYNIRAEETNGDLYAAIDLVIDKLERQFKKYRGKLSSKKNKVNNMDATIDAYFEVPESNETIVRRKEVFLKPIDEEEAITQMELLGHTFFVFKNVDTDKINVVYKRNDGDYGIIEAN